MSPTPESGGAPVSDPDSTKPPGPAGPAGSPASSSSSSGRVLRVLTGVQNTSALVFSVFVGVHLVSPVVAAIGGASAADKSLLLAREYYLPLEPLLVYLPLTLHILSSSAKRILVTLRTRRAPPLTISIITGYLLIPFVLPHVLVHRLIPQTAARPISSLSPSELGFDFVAHAIRSRPIQSVGAYIGFVGLIVPHAWVGVERIVPWLRRTLRWKGRGTGGMSTGLEAKMRGKNGRGVMYAFTATMAGIVAVALSRLWIEGQWISPIMAARYEAVFRATVWEPIVGAW